MVQLDIEEQDELRQNIQERRLDEITRSVGITALYDLEMACELARGQSLPKEASAVAEATAIQRIAKPISTRMGSQFKLQRDDNEIIQQQDLQQYLYEYATSYREIFLQALVLTRLDFVEGSLKAGSAAITSFMHCREKIRQTANLLWEAQWSPQGTAQIGLSRYSVECAQEVMSKGEYNRLPKLLELSVAQAGEVDPQAVLARRDNQEISHLVVRRLDTIWKLRWIQAPVRHDRTQLTVMAQEGQLRLRIEDELELHLVDDLSGKVMLMKCQSLLPSECGFFLQPSLLKGLLNTLTTSNTIYEATNQLQLLLVDSKLRCVLREQKVTLARLSVIRGLASTMVDALTYPSHDEIDIELETKILEQHLTPTRLEAERLTVKKYEIKVNQSSRQYANLFWTSRRLMSKLVFSTLQSQATSVVGLCGYPGGLWLCDSTTMEGPMNSKHFKELITRLYSGAVTSTTASLVEHEELLQIVKNAMSGSRNLFYPQDPLPETSLLHSEQGVTISPFTPAIRDFLMHPYGDELVHEDAMDGGVEIATRDEGASVVKEELQLSLMTMNRIHIAQHLGVERMTIGLLPLWYAQQGRLLPPSLPSYSHLDMYHYATGGAELSPGIRALVHEDQNAPPIGFVLDMAHSALSGDIFIRMEPIAGWLTALAKDYWNPTTSPLLWHVLLGLFSSSTYHLIASHVVSDDQSRRLTENCVHRSFQADLSKVSTAVVDIASHITFLSIWYLYQSAKSDVEDAIRCNRTSEWKEQLVPHELSWPGMETPLADIGPQGISSGPKDGANCNSTEHVVRQFLSMILMKSNDTSFPIRTQISISTQGIEQKCLQRSDIDSATVGGGQDAYRWLVASPDSPLRQEKKSYYTSKSAWEHYIPANTTLATVLSCELPIDLEDPKAPKMMQLKVIITQTIDLFSGTCHLKLTSSNNISELQSFMDPTKYAKLASKFTKSPIPPLIIRSWIAAVKSSPVEGLLAPLPHVLCLLETYLAEGYALLSSTDTIVQGPFSDWSKMSFERSEKASTDTVPLADARAAPTDIRVQLDASMEEQTHKEEPSSEGLGHRIDANQDSLCDLSWAGYTAKDYIEGLIKIQYEKYLRKNRAFRSLWLDFYRVHETQYGQRQMQLFDSIKKMSSRYDMAKTWKHWFEAYDGTYQR